MVSQGHPSLNPSLADKVGNIGERFLPVVTKLPPLKAGSRPQVCVYQKHLWLWDGTSWGVVSGALTAHDHTSSDGSGVLTDDEHDDYSQYVAISTPVTPSASYIRLYSKLEGSPSVAKLYYKTSDGTEVGPLAAATGSHNPVTLAGIYDYIQIDASQQITRYQIDLSTDVTGILADGNIPAGITRDSEHGDFTPQGHSSFVEHADISPAEGFVRKYGAGLYTAVKSNLSAAADPTVNDDQGDGYSEGSLWVNATTNKVFFCADPAVGAAVWKEVGAGGLDEKVKVSINDTIANYLIEKLVGEASSPLHTFTEVNDGGDEDLRVTGVYAGASQGGHVSTAAQTFGGLKTFNGGAIIDMLFALAKDTATIDANDEIALPSHPYVYLTCSGASDSLDGIVAGIEGQVLFLRPATGKDITLVHNGTVTTGKKLMINGEANYVMNEDHDFAIAIYDATAQVWNVLVPGGSGSGGHVIEDEATPLTARANLSIRGSMARAWDDTPDTVIEVRGRLYDAIVDTTEGLVSVTTEPPVYTTLAAAIAANHKSIFVRSNINTEADVTIGAGDDVERITGMGLRCSYLPNIGVQKPYVVIDNCSLNNKTITFGDSDTAAIGCVAFSMYITGTAAGNRIVFNSLAVGGTIIRCAFDGCADPITIATYGVDVTGCTFNAVSGTGAILMGLAGNSVIGCKFINCSVTTAAIYGSLPEVTVNGCLFIGSFPCIYTNSNLWNISGNIFKISHDYTPVRIGSGSCIAGNTFSASYSTSFVPMLIIGIGMNSITGNVFSMPSSCLSTGIATEGTSARPNLIATNLFFFNANAGSACIDLSNHPSQEFQMITGNAFISISGTVFYTVKMQNSPSNRAIIYGNQYTGYGTQMDRGMVLVRAYNNSGGILDWGRIVIDQAASGIEFVTTTTTPADPKVRGVIATTGYPSTGWASGKWGLICIGGVYPVLCDTVAVVAGDYLGTSATAGFATPDTTGGKGTSIGMALESKPSSASPIVFRAAASSSVGTPPGAPTAALAGAGAGNVNNGDHYYLVTFVYPGGETGAGAPSAVVTVVDKTTDGKVALSAIPTGIAGCTARKIYRTIAGGSAYLLLATIPDNVTTVYTDNIADSSLGGAVAGSLIISKPTGTVEFDIMVASIAICPNTPTITPPTGWLLIRNTSNSSTNPLALASYYKVAGASEPASYTWTLGSAVSGCAGGISSFKDGEKTIPLDVESGATTASGLTHATPSVTTKWDNSMIVTSHAFSSSETWTPPAGMTEAFEASSLAPSAAGGVSIEQSYVLQVVAGASGAKTATAAGNADVGCAQIAGIRNKVFVLCQIGKL